MRTTNGLLFSGADLSVGFNSDPIRIDSAVRLAVVLTVTGQVGLAGTLKLQVCDDVETSNPTGKTADVTGLASWVDCAASEGTVSASVSANGSYRVTLTATPDRWARVVWTPTAGSGTGLARFQTKAEDSQ